MKPYFPVTGDQPEPLRVKKKRRVRFEEVDVMGIVWHGRYASFFEDARVELGEKYSISYFDLYNNGVLAPLKKLHVDYFKPLTFGDDITIEGILHWTNAARINFEYTIKNSDEELSTTGYTVQMMLDHDHNILVLPPPYYLDFLERWKRGEMA